MSKAFVNSTIEQFHSANIVDKIWSLGPKKCGTNILLNLTDFEHIPFWDQAKKVNSTNERHDVETSFINGFQLATLAGPLCEEPMHGVCFIIEEWTVDKDVEGNQSYGPFSGNSLI